MACFVMRKCSLSCCDSKCNLSKGAAWIYKCNCFDPHQENVLGYLTAHSTGQCTPADRQCTGSLHFRGSHRWGRICFTQRQEDCWAETKDISSHLKSHLYYCELIQKNISNFMTAINMSKHGRGNNNIYISRITMDLHWQQLPVSFYWKNSSLFSLIYCIVLLALGNKIQICSVSEDKRSDGFCGKVNI